MRDELHFSAAGFYDTVIELNDVLVSDNETRSRWRYLYDCYNPTFTSNLRELYYSFRKKKDSTT